MLLKEKGVLDRIFILGAIRLREVASGDGWNLIRMQFPPNLETLISL